MKKTISVLMAVAMSFCMCFGVGSSTYALSGGAEENAVFDYDETTQTVTFSGSGAIDASCLDSDEWNSIKSSVKNIYIGEEITSIPECAFLSMESVEKLVVYNSECVIPVENITSGNGLFDDDVLKTITFYGFDESTVMTYAQNRDINFKHIYYINFITGKIGGFCDGTPNIITALEGETASEILEKSPSFSSVIPHTNGKLHYVSQNEWSPKVTDVTATAVYTEQFTREKCQSYAVYETITEPTETEHGKQKVTCSVCNNVINDNAVAHNYVQTSYTAPSCTSAGSITQTCTVCNATVTEELSALGHDFGTDNIEKYCTRCNTLNDNYVEPVTPTPTATATDEISQQATDETAKQVTEVTSAPAETTPASSVINPKSTSIKKLKKGKKKITVQWKKVKGVKGYQVQVATNKKFTKNKKSVTVKKQKTTKKTIKKLKSNKKYYVRVRTYKVVDGKKVYSKWSKVKTVKTK